MNIILITEMIGTVAFAISGALIGIENRLDIFGVLFIGVITATGGGIVRDCIIGNFPPSVFSSIYIIAAAVTSTIVFLVAYRKRKHFHTFRERIERINNIFDAAGLAAFSVTGARIVYDAGFSENALLVIIMGMTTGVGGGIFRDILVDKTPYVLKKHIYALASLAGSTLYFVIRKYIGENAFGTLISALSVFIIRMLATKFRWKLPKIDTTEEQKD